MKKIYGEFKKFINKGNIVDLSIAVILGTAFGKVVTSLTNNIIMPVISLITGKDGFENYKFVITEANIDEGIAENAIYYGTFIQTTIDFLLIAIVVFFFVRIINRLGDMSEKVIDEVEDASKSVVNKTEDILLDIKNLLAGNNENKQS